MIKRLLFLFAILSITSPVFPADSPDAPGARLGVLSFLTAHDWEAKLPDSPDGKKRSIHAHFAWAANHQAIVFNSAFVTDGKPMPYVDGMYVWNPQKNAIEMIYSEGDGTLTDGTVHAKDGVLVHEFRQMHPDGKIEEYVSHLTAQGTEKWTNAIFARKGNALTKLVQVEYLPAK